MRLGGIFAAAVVLTAASWSAAQQPGPQLVINPYFRAAPAAIPTSVVPTTSAEPQQSAAPPLARSSFTGDPIRALGAAVRPAGAPPTSTYAAHTPPMRFVPSADAKPLLAPETRQLHDTAVVTASATGVAPPAESSAEAASAARGSLADAVAASLQVTHLTTNPLRGGNISALAPTVAPAASPERAANPLR